MIVIAVVALIILGPERLPEAARTLGKGIADLRRAMEPARSAWADVTREINSTMQEVTASTTVQVTTKGEPITGNPWKVHPLAEGLSDEERDHYFETGALPDWRLAEIAAKGNTFTNTNGNKQLPDGELPELDYPTPHTALSTSPGSEAQEELYYPEPHYKSEEEIGG